MRRYLRSQYSNQPRGEDAATSKLTEADVRYIRCNPLGLTYQQLAARLGVHRRTVERVRYGETWVHVR